MKKIIDKLQFYVMRTMSSQTVKNYFINRRVKQIGKSNIPQNIGKQILVNSKELSSQGYTNLGLFLEDKDVDVIIEKTKNFKCFDPFRKELKEFSLSETPEVVHVANYRRKDLSTINEILDIANNTNVLEAVQDFLGAKPTISNINMWWSFSGKKEAEQAQYFHRDVDDFKFCKLFIYLTDVDMDNGPHVYVEGTSVSSKLTKIRRYKDDEIHSEFGEEKVKYFTAPKGSSFIVDTYGFHKGLLPNKGKRLLLQVQYSLNPIGIYNYEPVDIGEHKYDKYINRLIIK